MEQAITLLQPWWLLLNCLRSECKGRACKESIRCWLGAIMEKASSGNSCSQAQSISLHPSCTMYLFCEG